MRLLRSLEKKPSNKITPREIHWLTTLLAETIYSGVDPRVIDILNRIIEDCDHDQVFEMVGCIIDYKLERAKLGALGLHVYKEKSSTMEFYFDAIPLVTLLSMTITRQIIENDSITVFGICGETGSGKTEIARLTQRHLKTLFNIKILKQDDYFKLPPAENTKRRKKNPKKWIGPQEVSLDTMSEHIQLIKIGEKFDKPTILIGDQFPVDDKIRQETCNICNVDAVIFEGTYTGLLHDDLDFYIHLDIPYIQTQQRRLERDGARGDKVDNSFLKTVLTIEHKFISSQKKRADILVDDSYHIIKNRFSL